MANLEDDPGASTQQFRAYVAGDRSDTAKAGKRSAAPLVAVVVVAIIVVAAIAFFALR